MSEDAKEFDPATFDGVILEFKRVLCSVHGAVFQSQWPKGYPIFMIRAFQELTVVDGVWEEARRLSGLPSDGDVPVKLLELVMDRKPACCRIRSSKLVDLFVESGVGVLKRCKACHRKRLGTPIKAVNVEYAHCCFECMSTASATPQNMM